MDSQNRPAVALASMLNPSVTPGKLSLLILQPTPFCNLDCDYCYLPARQDRRRMTLLTLRAALARVAEAEMLGDRLSIVWHAGEPMAVPPEWYEHAFALCQDILPTGLPYEHYIQTNGTLIDERWCKLVKSHNVRVGISIDGPADLHDARRRTRAGAGTHARVMHGARILQAAEIPLHAICVLTREHLDRADDIVDFFVNAGIREVGFNVEEIDGINYTSSLGLDAVQKFRSFFERVVDRYRANPSQMTVREIERVLNTLLDPQFGRRGANPQTTPFGMLVIGWDGGVGTFSPELAGLSDPAWGSFTFGNVNYQSLASIGADRRLMNVRDAIARGVAACQNECPYFPICGGGAPANKLGETGRFDVTRTMFCTLTEMVVAEVVLSALDLDLKRAASGDIGALVRTPASFSSRQTREHAH
jgi:uncharacterized protein